MDRMYTHIRDRRAVEIYWMERMAVASTHTVPTAQRMVVADCAGHDLGAPPQRQLPHHWGLSGHRR